MRLEKQYESVHIERTKEIKHTGDIRHHIRLGHMGTWQRPVDHGHKRYSLKPKTIPTIVFVCISPASPTDRGAMSWYGIERR